MIPMLLVGWQASVMRGEEVGYFCKVAGVSIVTVGSLHSAVDTLTVDS